MPEVTHIVFNSKKAVAIVQAAFGGNLAFTPRQLSSNAAEATNKAIFRAR
jgi:hypothetical protein